MAKGATTGDSGIPVASDEPSLTAGPNGPTPLQDAYLVQKMRYFHRDRSPSGSGRERR
jgi:catalase